MIPRTKKLFISYRSTNHREVDLIADQLRSLMYDDGIAKYTTWQDKYDLEAGKSWWDGIIDAIIDCDLFVFHLTPEYLESAVCMAELNYAVERGRPIIPIVLESAYYISPRTKKAELEFWDDVPEWLSKYHFLFFNNDDFLQRFERAVAIYEANWPSDIEIRRPLNPDANAVHGNNYAVYATATERALQVAFEEAKPLFRELVQRNDEDFSDICRQWLIILDRYQELLDAKKHRAPRAIFQRRATAYLEMFPLDFVDELYPDDTDAPIIFDPNHLLRQLHHPELSLKRQQVPSEKVLTKPPAKPTSPSLMPAPFAWIDIPAGRGTMKTNESSVTLEIPTQAYQIAKYPITNAQFAQFVKADGYQNQNWWTNQGWKTRQKEKWTQPRYWTDTQWNGAEQPVVGVSWYEAVAFCLWLSDVTGEKIMLPTEAQWQYAAQGNDGRQYPWGNDWDGSRCNNNVDKNGIGKTTPVTQFEKVGASPFGMVDMAGNVWEWVLTDYGKLTNDINTDAERRGLRGGSWFNNYTDWFLCGSRLWLYPHGRNGVRGFRVSRFK